MGVAVATIRGQQRHRADHPGAALVPRVTGPGWKGPPARSQDEEGTLTIHVNVNLIDPLGKLKSVTLRYLAANKVAEKPKPSAPLSELAGCRELPLKIDGRLATAEVRLRKGISEVAMLYQVAGINGAEEETRTDSLVETIRAKPAAEANNVAAASPSANVSRAASPPGPSPSGKKPGSGHWITKILGSATGSKFKDVAPEGGVLVGFEIGVGKWAPTRMMISAIRPIFQTAGGEQTLGNQHGTALGKTVRVKAKPGYAVGAVVGKEAGVFIGGLAVKFMKLGKEALDPKDNYESDWVGDNLGFEKSISGGGAIILGIVGNENSNTFPGLDDNVCTGLGLMLKGSPPNSGSQAGAASLAGSTVPRGANNQFSSNSGKFTVKMPRGQRTFTSSRNLNLHGHQLSAQISVCLSDGVTFMTQSIGIPAEVMHSMSSAQRAQFFRDALANQCQGSIVEEQPITQGSHRGRQFDLQGRGKQSQAQMYVVGGYVLCAIVTGDSKDNLTSKKAQDFFSSFQLVDSE